jgi:hypothetical protein
LMFRSRHNCNSDVTVLQRELCSVKTAYLSNCCVHSAVIGVVEIKNDLQKHLPSHFYSKARKESKHKQ